MSAPADRAGRRRIRTRRAYQLMAMPFAALALYLAVGFAASLSAQRVRSDLPLFILFTGASALGLWRARSWGRSLALIFAIGNAGLGALGLVAVLVDGEFVFTPALQLAASMAIAYILTRPIFTLPEERDD